MTKPIAALSIVLLIVCSRVAASEDESGHHLPHHHVALLAGLAYEEEADGHHENGPVVGIEYIWQFREHWAVGAAFEFNAFGDHETRRQAILAAPVSYFPNEKWRLFAAPGIEFRERGEPDKALLRIGAGYEFELGEHMTLSPEVQVDFVSGGTRVFVLVLALGYGL